MSQNQIEILQLALKQEKNARKEAEKALEKNSKEFYAVSHKLKKNNTKLENLLVQKSTELQGFFDTIIDAYVVINLKGHVIKMNDAAKDLFGYNNDKERISVNNLIYKQDEKYAFDSFYELTEKGFFHNFTSRIVTKTKHIKWVQINASLLFDNNGAPIAAQGIIRDITQSKEDESLLIQSKNRLSSLIVNLDSAVLLVEENGKIAVINTKFCELFKIPSTPELMTGSTCSNLAKNSKHLLKNSDKFLKRIEQLLNNKVQVLGEEILMEDGTILERNFIPILKNNKYNGHLWTYKDISLERKYRKILESQKNKYSNIIANMNLGLLEIDKQGNILLINQSLSKMSGYSEHEIIGKTVQQLLPKFGGSEVFEKQKERRLNGESTSYEINIETKKGKLKNWLISGAPNYDLKGDIIGTIAICLDITAIKTLEKQKEVILKELENRNNELQEYAHIVSHDLKSPLRSISALTSWIKSDNQGKFDNMTLQNFELVDNTLDKMEQLISDVLTYSSIGARTDINEKVNLNTLVEDLKKILFVPKHITIKITNELPTVLGDKIKFQQVFQNLISNAVKFCDKEKGLVEINVSKKKSFYEFSVADNGIGIEKKYHKKIFKIFHSLQESKSSTGIGLSIVKKIIDSYKGEIWLESKPNKGTTFFFTIKK